MSSYRSIDEGYFDWLRGLVEPMRNINPSRTHVLLLEQLFKRPFDWSVPHDDNRVEDGKELRSEFLEKYNADESWLSDPCSVLEMLVALARRAAFEGEGEPDEWFWVFMDNLELRHYTDDSYDEWVEEKVHNILDHFINREYRADGLGGLFPLRDATADQTEVEIWYQMATYLLEIGT